MSLPRPKQLRSRGSWLMVLLGALLFLPFLGTAPLFDWDEINFAEAARELLLSGDWLRMQIDFKPFWEKPPLFIWLQALSMHLCGVNEYAARLPNALTGIATLVIIYNIGTLLFSRRFGLLWACAYAAALAPHLYFRSGIIDPLFNLFIFLSLWFFILAYWKHKRYPVFFLRLRPYVYLILSGAFAGLAVLTKGQVALILLAGTLGIFWLLRNQRLGWWYRHGKLQAVLRYDFRQWRQFIPLWYLGLFLLACMATMLTWYGTELLVNGWWFIREFIVYQVRLLTTADAGHEGFPGYHFVMVFFLCFPASVLALRALAPHQALHLHQQNFKKWMLILLWLVLILFSVVRTKIVHYSSMAYLPLSFLAAYVLYQTLQGRMVWRQWQGIVLLSTGGLLGTALTLLPLIAPGIGQYAHLVQDPFAQAAMQAQVDWPWYTVLPGVLLLAATGYAYWRFRQGMCIRGQLGLLLGCMLAASTLGTWHLHRIAGYSQQAATDFFASVADQEVYVMTLGYKSYAHLFYGRLKRPTHPQYYAGQEEGFDAHLQQVRNWLAHGAIDRDVYFCAKVSQKASIAEWFPHLEVLGERNGFVFYRRKAPVAKREP
ncbi:MAG: glycosyltransferase family 39 protein [Bacteroidetes bacterium]|nr:glycosyltransferase family 39 protein [Bacteroidota bacterium]